MARTVHSSCHRTNVSWYDKVICTYIWDWNSYLHCQNYRFLLYFEFENRGHFNLIVISHRLSSVCIWARKSQYHTNIEIMSFNIMWYCMIVLFEVFTIVCTSIPHKIPGILWLLCPSYVNAFSNCFHSSLKIIWLSLYDRAGIDNNFEMHMRIWFLCQFSSF